MHVYTTTGITAITITVQLSFSNSILSLVQNDRGAPYSASSWTAYIEGIFERHIAKKIGPTLLRSIFVTHCEKSNLSEVEKESMATAMRHSRRAVSKHWHVHSNPTHSIATSMHKHMSTHEPMPTNFNVNPYPLVNMQQKEHYDRRTQVDREKKGRKYTGGLLEKALSSATTTTEDSAGPSTREPPTDSDSDSDNERPDLGDIVAIVLQWSQKLTWAKSCGLTKPRRRSGICHSTTLEVTDTTANSGIYGKPLWISAHVGHVQSVYITCDLEVFTPWGVKFLCCHDYAFAACDVRVICEGLRSNVISGGGKKQHLRRQEEVLLRGKQSWCVRRSQTVKGSTFQPFIRRNQALRTRRTLSDVICLLPFCTPYMVCHENIMWCAWWRGFTAIAFANLRYRNRGDDVLAG